MVDSSSYRSGILGIRRPQKQTALGAPRSDLPYKGSTSTMHSEEILDQVTETPAALLIAHAIAEFLSRHDGYSLHIGETHETPTVYNAGHRTLAISVICPTSEPRLEKDSDQ